VQHRGATLGSSGKSVKSIKSTHLALACFVALLFSFLGTASWNCLGGGMKERGKRTPECQ
jgi:hypothetical protein